MHYLSVHDLVWINRLVTGQDPSFAYDALESTVAAQYQYGTGPDVRLLGATLVDELVRRRPFLCGNAQSAFVALHAFLAINGVTVTTDMHIAAAVQRALEDGTRGGGGVVTDLLLETGVPRSNVGVRAAIVAAAGMLATQSVRR